MSLRFLLLVSVLTAAVPAAAQSGTLERIRQNAAITMGFIEGAAPFSSLGEGGQPQGYSVDLCRRIARGIQQQLKLPSLELRWQQLTVQNRLDAVRSGQVDIECSTTTWTLSRQAEVDFSLITFVDGGSILSKSDARLSRLSQFGGKRIAVIVGTTTEDVLRAGLAERAIDARLIAVRTRAEGLKLLEAGEVDGFASDRTTLIMLAAGSSQSGALKLLDEDFSVEPYVFGIPRGDHEYRLAVNRALARLYRSGEILTVYDRWLGRLGPPSVLLSAAYFVQSLSD